MKPPYTHLSLDERRELFRLHSAKIPMRVIAQRLNRHPSTLYREVKRNWFFDKEPLYRGYFHVVAHEMAHGRRARLSKLSRDQPLAAYVVERLQAAWSPEQIAGRLQIEPESPGQITHETIYAFVYSPHGKALGLSCHLPMARRQRRTRYARKPRGFTIPLENTIEQRPPEIGARTSFGHWEGDLIAFRQDFGKANLTSLVERQSRYTILTRNPGRNATRVVAGVIGQLKALPASARQSVTFDRGTEFARYPLLKNKLGMASYFCKPQAPWQKGSVENANGRVRRFLSRDTDIAAVSDEALAVICNRLNATPRKCLGFRTPREVLMSHLGPISTTGSRSSLDPGLPGLRNPTRSAPANPDR